MRFASLCLILPAVALAACNSGNNEAEQAAAAAAQARNAAEAAAAAAAVPATQITGMALVRFDLVKGPAGQLVGTYVKTGPNTWTGPYPTTGQTIQWSARADAVNVTLYTDVPQITTVNLYVDTGDISSSAMEPAENFRVTNMAFQ